MTQQATLRPWDWPVGPYIIPSTGEGSNFSEGDWEILPALGESGPVAIVNGEANAALIVRAVNAYDDLLAAAESALSWINALGAHAPIQFGGEAEIAGQLLAAITKAKGPSPRTPSERRGQA